MIAERKKVKKWVRLETWRQEEEILLVIICLM